MAVDASLEKFLLESVSSLNSNFDSSEKDIRKDYKVIAIPISFSVLYEKDDIISHIIVSSNSTSVSFNADDISTLSKETLKEISALSKKINNA